MKKKLLSLLLAIVMVVGLIPAMVIGVGADGGSYEPYTPSAKIQGGVLAMTVGATYDFTDATEVEIDATVYGNMTADGTTVTAVLPGYNGVTVDGVQYPVSITMPWTPVPDATGTGSYANLLVSIDSNLNLTIKSEDIGGTTTVGVIPDYSSCDSWIRANRPWKNLKLKSITFDSSITKTGAYLFKSSTGSYDGSATKLIFNDGITSLGTLTNYYSSMGGASILIPDSVTNVDHTVFGAGYRNFYFLSNQDYKIYTFDWVSPEQCSFARTERANCTVHVSETATRMVNYLQSKDGTAYPYNYIIYKELGQCGATANRTHQLGYSVFEEDEDNYTLTILYGDVGDGRMADYESATDAPWSKYADKITKVVVSDGVTSIGNNAFASLTNLALVEVADSVEAVGANSFKTVDDADEELENQATAFVCGEGSAMSIWLVLRQGHGWLPHGSEANFDWDITGTKLTITPNTNPAVIDSNPWFPANSVITSVEIKTGATEIADSVFAGMPKLAEVTLPSTLTTIGDSAFANCNALVELYIPKAVTSVSDTAFTGTAEKAMTIAFSSQEESVPTFATTQGNTVITLDTENSLKVLFLGSSVFQVSTDFYSIVKGMGYNTPSIAWYYCAGATGGLTAYANYITNHALPEEGDAIGRYIFNAVEVKNNPYSGNDPKELISSQDWDYILIVNGGLDEKLGKNGEDPTIMSDDPALPVLKDAFDTYAPGAEIVFYQIYSYNIATEQVPGGIEATWQAYVDAYDDGMSSYVDANVPVATVIQNARHSWLNADGGNLLDPDQVHMFNFGNKIIARAIYEVMLGDCESYNFTSWDDQTNTMAKAIVDVTLANPNFKELTLATVEHDGNVSYYDSLADAAAAAVSGDTLTFYAMPKSDSDITIASGVTVNTYGSAANHTSVLTNGGKITADGLVVFAGGAIDGNTANFDTEIDAITGNKTANGFNDASISLKDNTWLNFYTFLTDENVEDYTYTYVIDGVETEIDTEEMLKKMSASNELGYEYRLSVALKPYQLADGVTVNMYDLEGNLVCSKTDSVRDYAGRRLEASQNENYKAALRALLEYGAAVQVWQGYKTNDLANSILHIGE